jgi:hypothetical protein
MSAELTFREHRKEDLQRCVELTDGKMLMASDTGLK